MSTRELAYSLIDRLPEHQIEPIEDFAKRLGIDYNKL